MGREKLPLILFGIMVIYVIAAFIGTQGNALFAGDGSMHIAMAQDLLQNPETLFAWHDMSGAGSPAYMFYQPLPHMILAFLFMLGNVFSMYRIALVLLFMFLPMSMYFSIKRIGFSKRVSIIMALLPLMVSSFTGFGFESASVFGWGLFTQLMAMVLFPITISYLYQVIHEDKKLAQAILFVSLTMLCNSIIGFLTLPVAAIITVLDTRRFWSRLLTLCEVVTGSFVVLAFWALPILAQRPYYGGILKPDIFLYSIGYIGVFIQFLSGRLLDVNHYIPMLTILAIVGIILVSGVILRKRKDSISKWLYNKRALKERFILYGIIIGIILFAGGKWLHALPILSFFELHRFIFLLHFFLFLAIAYAIDVIIEKWKKAGLIVIIILAVFMLSFSFKAIYDSQQKVNNMEINPIDEMKLVANVLDDYPDARVLIQNQIYRPAIPMLYYYAHKPLIDAPIESQASMSTQYIRNAFIDDVFFWKYNVGYAVLNKSFDWDYPRHEVGNYYVYILDGKGYFDVDALCGSVIAETSDYEAIVRTNKPCAVIFKMTYNPEWHAFVDGQKQAVSVYGDSLIVFMVSQGEHEIVMKYERLWYRMPLFILGLMLLFLIFLFERKK